MSVEIRELRKSYAELSVFRDFDMNVADSRITALSGPSGCGTTPLHGMIAGLTPPASDSVAGGRTTGLSVFLVLFANEAVKRNEEKYT